MKVNEIKRTIEEVVRVEYVAEDGTVFRDKAECEKYEESALFVASKKLKRLNKEYVSIYDLLEEGSDEEEIEIFDIQTQEDLDNLKKYLYLKLSKNHVSEADIRNCFTSSDGTRKDYVFEGVTYGHEVIIFWNYDEDHFWVHKDGSFDDYLEYLREKFNKLCSVEEN